VDDVLDLARIEAGKISMTRAQVNLGVLIREATNMVADYIAAKGLALHVRMDENLPELWIDRLRIRQVMLNLLVNAARFTKQGSITVDAAQHGNEVMVRVTDTGQGIRDEDLPHVFKEFQPTELHESGWHSGTGLGLPISKKFVAMHQGRMGVESTYLQGATFWFTLPCGSPESIGDGASPLTRAEPVGHINDEERIVVLVHRDPTAPRLLQRYLDHHHLVGAETPEEGLALARDLRAIALLCDVREPLPDGTQDGPIVVRCHLPSASEAAKTLGASQFLTKPVSREELLSALDRVGRPIKRVLIADDDPEVVRLFQRILRGRIAPQDCLEAYDGAEAWALLQAERPDVVLLDLMMPKLTGQEILAQMAQDPTLKDIPVIVISAHEQDYTPAGAPGLIEVQRKEPFRTGEMVRTLEGIFSALSPGWH
jgi:CheY-like chemotaxis protein